MGDNKIIDAVIDKIPQAKDAIGKVEETTGKKVEEIASDVGNKISDVIKEQSGEAPKDVFGNIAGKIFNKN